jgi:uncharacterized protein with von Willebrand factor type A (vWA) domain
MTKETEVQPRDKDLTRIVRKAFRRIEKMYREEPHIVVISDGDGDNSSSTINEITVWLFKRRQDNGDTNN